MLDDLLVARLTDGVPNQVDAFAVLSIALVRVEPRVDQEVEEGDLPACRGAFPLCVDGCRDLQEVTPAGIGCL